MRTNSNGLQQIFIDDCLHWMLSIYKTADDGGKTPESELDFDKTPRLQVSSALSLLPS